MKTALIVDGNYLRTVINRFYDLASFTPERLNWLSIMVGGGHQMADSNYLITVVLAEYEKRFGRQAQDLCQSGWQVKYLIWNQDFAAEPKALEEAALLGYVVGKVVAEKPTSLFILSGAKDLIPLLQTVRKESSTELVIVAHSQILPAPLTELASQVWLLDNPNYTPPAYFRKVIKYGVWTALTHLREVNT